jgi:hypothetical protein
MLRSKKFRKKKTNKQASKQPNHISSEFFSRNPNTKENSQALRPEMLKTIMKKMKGRQSEAPEFLCYPHPSSKTIAFFILSTIAYLIHRVSIFQFCELGGLAIIHKRTYPHLATHSRGNCFKKIK